LGGIAVVALALSFAASSATAQDFHGNPNYANTNGPGVVLKGFYGRGVNDEAFKSNFFGGSIGVNLPVFGFWAGVGSVKPEDFDSEVVFGGGVSLQVPMPPMSPVMVGIEGGASFLDEDGDKTLIVPIGAVLGINVPSPAVDVVPWVKPRVEIQRLSNGTSTTEVGFGASGGISITLPTGLGFHAAVDWHTIDYGAGAFKPIYVGAGVHYNISVPSLGVPGV
jgi:hypothetical protein